MYVTATDIKPKLIEKRCIVSGNIIEIYEYEKPFLKGYSSKSQSAGRQNEEITSAEVKKDNREKVTKRAQRDIRRIVNANMTDVSKFVTLTFEDDVTALEVANRLFKKFIRRLREVYGKKDLKYLCVPEFTKKGRVHFHVVFFNLPYIKNSILKDIWSRGFVKINKIDNCDNVGAYVCKYISKDLEKMKGYKSYSTSRNLKQPTEIEENKMIENLEASLPSEKVKFTAVYENEYTGKLKYTQYNLNEIDVKKISK